jgi:hypothetical protein
LFERPLSTAQRHYEICRAYFLERLPAEELAERFALPVGSIRVLVRDFARNPDLGQFFCTAQAADRPAPKREAIRDRACSLRRQGDTLAQIITQLQAEGFLVSEAYLVRLVHTAGRAPKGPRCHTVQPADDHADDGSLRPALADIHQFARTNARQFTTKVAGLFLFLPQRLDLDLAGAVRQAGLPGSKQIPPLQAFLALLVPQLLGQRRISHISDLCADDGAGLFAGLNVLPKTPYATDYSYCTDRTMHERLVAAIVAQTPLGDPPFTFNLDLHAIPFRGHEPDLEKHGVAMRNRALTAGMAFVAQAAGRRILCYATAHVLRSDSDNLVPRLAAYGKEQTGPYPARLLVDARATTDAGRNTLNQAHVGFITMRRRGARMRTRAQRLAPSSWQTGQIIQAKGKRRQVSAVDEMVSLDGDEGPARQRIVTGLGHASPTCFLTNDRPQRQTAREVLQTYASRNHVENRLGEQITFLHLDCLGSAVRLNVDFDLTLTVVADLLDRGVAERLKGFAQASPQRWFRKYVETPGSVPITAEEIVVRLSKRSHNPLLREARLTQRTGAVPWLGGRTVRVECP